MTPSLKTVDLDESKKYDSHITKSDGFPRQFRSMYPRGLKLMDYVNRGDVDVDMAKNLIGRPTAVSAMLAKRIKEDKELERLASSFDKSTRDNDSLNEIESEHDYEKTDPAKSPESSTSKLDILESITVVAWLIPKIQSGEVPQGRWLYLCNKFKQYHGDIMNDLEHIPTTFKLDDPKISEPPTCIENILHSHQYSKTDLQKWVKCFESQTLHQALQHMHAEDQWPQFLSLYTLKRNARSAVDVYEAVRMYQRVLPTTQPAWQMALFIRSIRLCSRLLPDYIPVVTRIFIMHANPEAKTQANYNQMLWQLANFGTSLRVDFTKTLIEAQRIVVADMKESNIDIDTKGYLALGYTLGVVAPDKAEGFVSVVKQHNYPFSKEEILALKGDDELASVSWGRFPYRQGIYALELSLAQNSVDAFRIFDSIPKEYRVAMLWATLITRLRNLEELTPQTAGIIWDHIKQQDVRLSSFLVSRLLQAFENNPQYSEEVSQVAARQNVPTTRSTLGGQFFYRLAKKSRADAIAIFNKIPRKSLYMYEMMMRAQLSMPSTLWDTYCQMKQDGYDPSVDTLIMLCRAACNTRLKWGGLFAPQQAVVEFKTWVRGANLDGSDAEDLFKLYPTARLFHHYIVMLGRARYEDGLLDVLPWMERINFTPDKMLLCAIIHYSPNGKYLQKHGNIVGGEWPTESDMELFKTINDETRRNVQ